MIRTISSIFLLICHIQSPTFAATHTMYSVINHSATMPCAQIIYPTDSTVKVVYTNYASCTQYSSNQDPVSLYLYDQFYGIIGDYDPYFLYENKSEGIWTVKDTASLDFSQELQLTDTSLFSWAHSTQAAGRLSGVLVKNATIIFKTSNNNYALCHSTSQDTSFWASYNMAYFDTFSRTYLACQVQDNGTTKFDSIPQYPHETSALIPIPTVRATASPLPSRFYGVDGSRINMQRRVFHIVNTK